MSDTKRTSNTFPIPINIGIKQGYTLSSLVFNMVLHYAIGKLEKGGIIMESVPDG